MTSKITERPWGSYESLTATDSHQVKRIIVTPGGKLSLQKHARRAEHWIIAEGMATVTVQESVLTLSQNQHVFIPPGAVHRLENHGAIDLVLIEIQLGDYFGEDDIIRLEDVYGRV